MPMMKDTNWAVIDEYSDLVTAPSELGFDSKCVVAITRSRDLFILNRAGPKLIDELSLWKWLRSTPLKDSQTSAMTFQE